MTNTHEVTSVEDIWLQSNQPLKRKYRGRLTTCPILTACEEFLCVSDTDCAEGGAWAGGVVGGRTRAGVVGVVGHARG